MPDAYEQQLGNRNTNQQVTPSPQKHTNEEHHDVALVAARKATGQAEGQSVQLNTVQCAREITNTYNYSFANMFGPSN